MLTSAAPEALARWYSERLGVPLPLDVAGGRYTILETSLGPFHFGIRPQDGTAARAAVVLTFRVGDFDREVERLGKLGIHPVERAEDEDGRFASFLDPDGNEVLLWGD